MLISSMKNFSSLAMPAGTSWWSSWTPSKSRTSYQWADSALFSSPTMSMCLRRSCMNMGLTWTTIQSNSQSCGDISTKPGHWPVTPSLKPWTLEMFCPNYIMTYPGSSFYAPATYPRLSHLMT
jgi:hypothetical protein